MNAGTRRPGTQRRGVECPGDEASPLQLNKKNS